MLYIYTYIILNFGFWFLEIENVCASDTLWRFMRTNRMDGFNEEEGGEAAGKRDNNVHAQQHRRSKRCIFVLFLSGDKCYFPSIYLWEFIK